MYRMAGGLKWEWGRRNLRGGGMLCFVYSALDWIKCSEDKR